jgi:hypothetical protein
MYDGCKMATITSEAEHGLAWATCYQALRYRPEDNQGDITDPTPGSPYDFCYIGLVRPPIKDDDSTDEDDFYWLDGTDSNYDGWSSGQPGDDRGIISDAFEGFSSDLVFDNDDYVFGETAVGMYESNDGYWHDLPPWYLGPAVYQCCKVDAACSA